MNHSKQLLAVLGTGGLIAAACGGWIFMNPATFAALIVLLVAWLVATRPGRLAAAMLGIALSTLRERTGATIVIIAGIGGVVAVLVALQSMSQGLQRTLHNTGDTQTVIVLSGSSTEASSFLTPEKVAIIAEKPGALQDRDGKAVLSAETLGVVRLPKKSSGARGNLALRGVGARAAEVRGNVRIVQGRTFRPGTQEMIVGVGARRVFAGLEIGQTVDLNNQRWTIVGAFESADAHESELFGDADTLGAAFRRPGYQSVIVRLAAPEAFDQFKAALTSDRRLDVNVRTTLDYYTSSRGTLVDTIHRVANVIAAIMAIGALFGALNVSYTTVQTRSREIATLRALGFDAVPVIASVMLETMLLATLGGALGAALAWSVFHEFTGSTFGADLGALIFQFDVSGPLLWTGLKWALAIGFVGGMLPAMRAGRLPAAVALRAT